VADPFGFNLRDLPARLDALDPLLYQPVGSASAIRTSDRELVDLLGKTLSKFWGPLEGEALLHASQAVQAIGIQYAVEACRRRQGRCAGVIPARFNPSWPEAGDTACVEYSGRPRAAYYAVKRAYRPFHVSAAFPTFAWNAEARLRADVWLHNDGEERSLLNVVASLAELEGRELYQENLAAEVGAGSSENVGDLSWRFPPGFAGPFLLLLEVIDEEGETLARNAYLHSRAPDPPFAPFLSAPETCLEAERSPAGVAVRNTGRTTALGVRIEAEAALVGDSDFPLLPGARREIRLSSSEDSVTVSAWNAPAQTTEPL